MDYSIIFVCLIVLTTLLGRVCGRKQQAAPAAAISTPAAAPAVNQQELIAAISAAIAEDLGTDITGIRILSVKKL